MTLKYFQAQINGFVNNTDEFIILVGYRGYLSQPLVSSNNYWSIQVSMGGNIIDEVGTNVNDNGLTQSYMQVNTGNFYKRTLIIPPGASVGVYTSNGTVEAFGLFIQGSIDEVIKLL